MLPIARLALFLLVVGQVKGTPLEVFPQCGKDCEARRQVCTVFAPDGGYTEQEFSVAVQPKTGAVYFTPEVEKLRASATIVDESRCRVISKPADIDPNEKPVLKTGSCACFRQDAGQDCKQRDGGVTVRNGRNEFQPGDWVGAGCVPKACGELFGRTNWPEGCVR